MSRVAPTTPRSAPGPRVGESVADLEISGAWLVDPTSGREGPGEVVVTDGIIEAVTWLDDRSADGASPDRVIVVPGFVDLHTHLREPGNEDAETISSGLAAAAHGGFTTVCAMPNTEPALDDPAVLGRMLAAAAASGVPVRLLAHGAVTASRSGERLAPLGELADGGVVGFTDDGAPIASSAVLRSALAYAGQFGLPIVDHPEDRVSTDGAEANEGLVATVLGLRGWPAGAEASAVGRDLAVLADALRAVPAARLHLTNLSTAASPELVRDAKRRGLPLTCDVTPHHLALTDEWLAGARRWAWEVPADSRGPWADGALVAEPYDPACRVNPPLRSAADARACLTALADGTVDAVATDHAPHASVDKDLEFGLAATGISGLETALGVLLAAVHAGELTLRRAIEALTVGPAGVLGARFGREGGPCLVAGRRADLVVIDRAATWRVEPAGLRSRGHNTPLLGRDLAGLVLLTVADGRIAYAADDEIA